MLVFHNPRTGEEVSCLAKTTIEETLGGSVVLKGEILNPTTQLDFDGLWYTNFKDWKFWLIIEGRNFDKTDGRILFTGIDDFTFQFNSIIADRVMPEGEHTIQEYIDFINESSTKTNVELIVPPNERHILANQTTGLPSLELNGFGNKKLSTLLKTLLDAFGVEMRYHKDSPRVMSIVNEREGAFEERVRDQINLNSANFDVDRTSLFTRVRVVGGLVNPDSEDDTRYQVVYTDEALAYKYGVIEGDTLFNDDLVSEDAMRMYAKQEIYDSFTPTITIDYDDLSNLYKTPTDKCGNGTMCTAGLGEYIRVTSEIIALDTKLRILSISRSYNELGQEESKSITAGSMKYYRERKLKESFVVKQLNDLAKTLNRIDPVLAQEFSEQAPFIPKRLDTGDFTVSEYTKFPNNINFQPNDDGTMNLGGIKFDENNKVIEIDDFCCDCCQNGGGIVDGVIRPSGDFQTWFSVEVSPTPDIPNSWYRVNGYFIGDEPYTIPQWDDSKPWGQNLIVPDDNPTLFFDNIKQDLNHHSPMSRMSNNDKKFTCTKTKTAWKSYVTGRVYSEISPDLGYSDYVATDYLLYGYIPLYFLPINDELYKTTTYKKNNKTNPMLYWKDTSGKREIRDGGIGDFKTHNLSKSTYYSKYAYMGGVSFDWRWIDEDTPIFKPLDYVNAFLDFGFGKFSSYIESGRFTNAFQDQWLLNGKDKKSIKQNEKQKLFLDIDSFSDELVKTTIQKTQGLKPIVPTSMVEEYEVDLYYFEYDYARFEQNHKEQLLDSEYNSGLHRTFLLNEHPFYPAFFEDKRDFGSNVDRYMNFYDTSIFNYTHMPSDIKTTNDGRFITLTAQKDVDSRYIKKHYIGKVKLRNTTGQPFYVLDPEYESWHTVNSKVTFEPRSDILNSLKPYLMNRYDGDEYFEIKSSNHTFPKTHNGLKVYHVSHDYIDVKLGNIEDITTLVNLNQAYISDKLTPLLKEMSLLNPQLEVIIDSTKLDMPLYKNVGVEAYTHNPYPQSTVDLVLDFDNNYKLDLQDLSDYYLSTIIGRYKDETPKRSTMIAPHNKAFYNITSQFYSYREGGLETIHTTDNFEVYLKYIQPYTIGTLGYPFLFESQGYNKYDNLIAGIYKKDKHKFLNPTGWVYEWVYYYYLIFYPQLIETEQTYKPIDGSQYMIPIYINPSVLENSSVQSMHKPSNLHRSFEINMKERGIRSTKYDYGSSTKKTITFDEEIPTVDIGTDLSRELRQHLAFAIDSRSIRKIEKPKIKFY